jgi:mannose-6-phosphate isomerase-like protein (cupin superfamily)
MKRVAFALVALGVLYVGVGALLHTVVFPEPEPPAWAYPKSGFAFETPTGERIRVVRAGAETGGELAQLEFDLLPGGMTSRGRLHVHPRMEERFQVLSGSAVAIIDGEEKVVSAGETVVVPPGTPHRLFNPGSVEMRSLVEVRPAGKGALLFGQLAGVGFRPSFLQVMLYVKAYDMYPADPPPPVLRALSFLLAPTARLAGYRSFDAEAAKRFLRVSERREAESAGATPP